MNTTCLLRSFFLKPLRLTGQVGFLDQYEIGKNVSSQMEYRAILNYEVTWRGPRMRASQ